MKSQVLHTVVWQENKIFVAKFLEIELASQGKTKEEALKNLKEALDLYLEDEPKKNDPLSSFLLYDNHVVSQ